MKELAGARATYIWLLLMAATCLSWYLGTNLGQSTHDAQISATVGIIMIAFVKVRLVITHFMELGEAPWVLRALCDLWIAILCTALLTLYLYA